jgi:flavin reductase (DIM6/NTAB) family NADH-FMN oxidoreductase RutF
MHKTIEPSILYFGTPVVVVSTLNEDESTNIAPMSSAWWLGWSCMLGLDATSKTTANLRRTGECVLNLAADQNVGSVNDLALLTGSASLPPHKKALGYRSSARKFEEAGLTRQASELVRPEGIREFPVHLEATVQNIYDFATNDPRMAIRSCAVEVTIHRVHAEDGLLDKEHPHRIDPDRWRPLIMSFRQLFGLATINHSSRLGLGPEEMYAPWKTRAQ